MFSAIERFNKDSTNAECYKKLFLAIKNRFKDLSFYEINDRIEAFYKQNYKKPEFGISDKALDKYLKNDIEDIFKEVLMKVRKFQNVSGKPENIAKILVKHENRKERSRLNKVRILDVQMDRLFKDPLYISKNQGLSDITRSLFTKLFLTTQMKKLVDERFLNALDFGSLVRLSLIKGGETIRIPTFSEIEVVLASTYYFYLVKYAGMFEEDARRKTFKDLRVKVLWKEVKEDYNELLLLYSKEIKDVSSPISQTLEQVSAVIRDLQEYLKDSVSQINNSEEFLVAYKDVNKAFLELNRGLSEA